MKRNVLYIILLYLISWNANSQIDNDSNLEQFNLYVLPQAQIEVQLSFDSRILRNDPRAFSVTPGREGIDMMAIYREKQDLEEKEYIPFVVAHFERKRQQQQEQQQSTLSRPSSLTVQIRTIVIQTTRFNNYDDRVTLINYTDLFTDIK